MGFQICMQCLGLCVKLRHGIFPGYFTSIVESVEMAINTKPGETFQVQKIQEMGTNKSRNRNKTLRAKRVFIARSW